MNGNAGGARRRIAGLESSRFRRVSDDEREGEGDFHIR